MIFIKVDENENVTTKHYQPFDSEHGFGKTEDELLQIGFLVDSVPTTIEKEGKTAITKYNETNGFYFEYVDKKPTQEEQLEQLKIRVKAQNQAIAELTMLLSTPTT